MFKLTSVVILIFFSFQNIGYCQHKYVYVLKDDTAFVNFNNLGDTTRFQIEVKSKSAKIDDYRFDIVVKSLAKRQLLFIENNNLSGGKTIIKLKSASYFSHYVKNIKSAYPTMIEEPYAFIFNGISKVQCITLYELQKNLYGGYLKIGFSQKYGIFSLEINNGGEEKPLTVLGKFKLISADGLSPIQFFKNNCKIKKQLQ